MILPTIDIAAIAEIPNRAAFLFNRIEAILASPWRAREGRPVAVTFPRTLKSFEIFLILI